MIVIDSSALIAILLNEPEAETFAKIIASSNDAVMSAPNFVEAEMVGCSRKQIRGPNTLDKIIAELGVQIVSFTAKQSHLAIDAFLRYGKGRHPAGLNMGDCFAYALAKDYIVPLLFKGNDFSQTDIKLAIL